MTKMGVKNFKLTDAEKVIDELAPQNNGFIDFETFKKLVYEYY